VGLVELGRVSHFLCTKEWDSGTPLFEGLTGRVPNLLGQWDTSVLAKVSQVSRTVPSPWDTSGQ
jgi:hypothetical protein